MSGLENSNKILKMEINARIPNAAPPIQGEMSPLGTLDRGYAPAVDTTNSHVHNLNPMRIKTVGNSFYPILSQPPHRLSKRLEIVLGISPFSN